MRVPILIGSACIAALGCLPDQPDGSAGDAAAPRVRLRLSGHLEGRLEPCGCASGQMGGLARRAFLLLQDRNYDLLIEGGDLTVDGDELDELKLMTMLSVMSALSAKPESPRLSAGSTGWAATRTPSSDDNDRNDCRSGVTWPASSTDPREVRSRSYLPA